MQELLERIRTRLVPAVLTAAGVTLVAAGLLSYTGPVEAQPGSSDPPTAIEITPSPAAPSSSAVASPSGSVAPSPSEAFPADRVATRVVIPALGIDLPVVKPPGGTDAYPLCNVAMYIQQLGQPGSGRATYIYAHARTGMFLPILEASKVNNGVSMLTMLVEVYTSDNMLFLYEVVRVLRHQLNLDEAFNATTEELWLQTSEGPHGTPGKTQLVAKLLSSSPVDPVEAHPQPHPVVCG